MQLAGQAQPLPGHRPAGQLRPGPLQLGGPLQLDGVGAADPHKVAQQPRGANDQRIAYRRRCLEPARGELDGRRTDLGGGQAGQRDPPAPVGRHRIDRHQDGHPKHHRRQPKGRERQPAAHTDPKHRPGKPPPHRQRQSVQQHQPIAQDERPARHALAHQLDKQGRTQPGRHQRQPAVEQPGADRQPTQPAGPFLHDLTLPPPGTRHIHPQVTTSCRPGGDTRSSTDVLRLTPDDGGIVWAWNLQRKDHLSRRRGQVGRRMRVDGRCGGWVGERP